MYKMKALKCKHSAQFAYNYYSINALSKCSNIISHRSSKSTPRSPKVDTSIFESRHIDLRKSTHRSSKIEGGQPNIASTIRRRILSATAFHSVIVPHGISDHIYKIRRSYTRPHEIYSNSNTVCAPHVH